jgi:hypothetical protein
MATPTTALLMRSDATACRVTAARLRGLGFAVREFDDDLHLYAHAISLGPNDASYVILAEPTNDMVRDLEVLRAGHRSTPMVLVGSTASPETARRLRAACVAREEPSTEELRAAIDIAVRA